MKTLEKIKAIRIKEEDRVTALFKAYGRNHSYSTSEIGVLRSLGLLPQKINHDR